MFRRTARITKTARTLRTTGTATITWTVRTSKTARTTTVASFGGWHKTRRVNREPSSSLLMTSCQSSLRHSQQNWISESQTHQLRLRVIASNPVRKMGKLSLDSTKQHDSKLRHFDEPNRLDSKSKNREWYGMVHTLQTKYM